MNCSIQDCHERVLARGLCSRHYKRLYERGLIDTAPRIVPLRGPVCTVPGCDAPHKARGFCAKHYRRWARYGDVRDEVLPPKRANGSGSINRNGYLILKIDGRSIPAHRLVMERILGRPLRSFESVHHKNGIRHDNRPENLELWCKPGHGAGQRPDDLVAWVIANYPEAVAAALENRNQLRLVG